MASTRNDRGRQGRGGGGNREDEQGGASSSQAATEEESLPSDSLHQSNRPARHSFPPPRYPLRSGSSLQAPTQEESLPSYSLHQFNQPARQSFPPSRYLLRPRPPPASFHSGSNYQDFETNSLPIPSELRHAVESVFPAAREAQQPRQGALQRRERNLAGAASSQQTSSYQSDSSPTAREKPVRNLLQELQPSNTPKRRRTSYNVHQQDSTPRLAQANDSQESKISSLRSAFNPQNFNAPGPGFPAGQAPVQAVIAGFQSMTLAPGAPGSATAVQRQEEKPFPDPRPKPDPIHCLPLKKRRLPLEIMDVDNQEGVPAECNPPEEQLGNPEDTNSNSDADSSKGGNRKSSEPK